MYCAPSRPSDIIGLEEVDLARPARGAAIEREDRNALLVRLLNHRHDRVGVDRIEDQRVDALVDQVDHHRRLRVRVSIRIGVEQGHARSFGRRVDDALRHALEERVGERRDVVADLDWLAFRKSRRPDKCGGSRGPVARMNSRRFTINLLGYYFCWAMAAFPWKGNWPARGRSFARHDPHKRHLRKGRQVGFGTIQMT